MSDPPRPRPSDDEPGSNTSRASDDASRPAQRRDGGGDDDVGVHEDPLLSADDQNAYWRKNVTYVGALLSIWFVVSFGGGILLAEPLNSIRVPGTGFKLGFWLAQQGSIYVFVVLIFTYVMLMRRLDRTYARRVVTSGTPSGHGEPDEDTSAGETER